MKIQDKLVSDIVDEVIKISIIYMVHGVYKTIENGCAWVSINQLQKHGVNEVLMAVQMSNHMSAVITHFGCTRENGKVVWSYQLNDPDIIQKLSNKLLLSYARYCNYCNTKNLSNA